MFENKKIGVFGLGLSGIATLKYLSKKEVDFIAFDDKEETIKKIIKDHPEFSKYLKDLADEAWGAIDYLILSPGISLTHPEPHKIVKLVKQRNIKIICDIEVLYLNNKDAFFIGITGTNGKSTTTSLIAHILKYNNVNVVLGGNIGIPVLSFDDISESEHDEGERKFVMLSDSETSRNNYTDWILRQVPQNDEKRDTVFVLEVSSFQLDLLDKTKFNIAVFLNITPDHLDRHGNMENYTNSK
ncbi:MAG: Mur ligase family protein, partial [Pseudomonadota bacterium]